jgi:hypothetical protein
MIQKNVFSKKKVMSGRKGDGKGEKAAVAYTAVSKVQPCLSSSPSPGPGCLYGPLRESLPSAASSADQNGFDNCNFFTQSALNLRLLLT